MSLKHILAGSLLILAAHSLSVNAESVDLRVVGTLIPGACTPTLGNSGVIDYGYITASQLNPDAYTPLAVKSIELTIICTAPAKIAIKAVNNRPGTVAGGVENGVSLAAPSPVALFEGAFHAVVGLGLNGSVPIGGYALRAVGGSFRADDNDVVNIWQNADNDPDNWDLTTNATSLYTVNSTFRHISWAAPGTDLPLAFTMLNGQLEVQAYINHRELLNLSNAIQLNGLTTIEIVYL